jgi:hypothetical protein
MWKGKDSSFFFTINVNGSVNSTDEEEYKERVSHRFPSFLDLRNSYVIFALDYADTTMQIKINYLYVFDSIEFPSSRTIGKYPIFTTHKPEWVSTTKTGSITIKIPLNGIFKSYLYGFGLVKLQLTSITFKVILHPSTLVLIKRRHLIRLDSQQYILRFGVNQIFKKVTTRCLNLKAQLGTNVHMVSPRDLSYQSTYRASWSIN